MHGSNPGEGREGRVDCDVDVYIACWSAISVAQAIALERKLSRLYLPAVDVREGCVYGIHICI